ncbi:reductase with broad range of substrate specificity [Mrakia frigida]|uniref:reductase with broad range of substrate specificity n=1 Tax=Mrakia frigida TaxID=29902 RepID=UPI003FCBFCC6
MSVLGQERRADPEQDYSIKSLFSLKGKTAIVTGGGSGIGLAVSQAYAEAGANVAIIYNSTNQDHIAEEIAKEFGVKVKAFKCNVSLYEDIEKVFGEIAKEFGQYDIMVANSGVQQTTSCLDLSPKQWRDVMAVNLDGVFYCLQIAAKYFKANKIKGVEIVTSSMSGHIVNFPQKQGAYNAAKAGCIHLVKSLAVEFAAFDVRVNSVSPGYINTIPSRDYDDVKGQWYAGTPMGRDADTRELKGVYLYLASNASSFTTGTDILVDGGFCLP